MNRLGRVAGLMLIPAVVAVGKVIMDKLAGEPYIEPGSPPDTTSQPSLGGTVDPALLALLVCPEDKGSLELVDEGRYLQNPRNGYRYPIRDGIPIMLIEEGRANRVPS